MIQPIASANPELLTSLRCYLCGKAADKMSPDEGSATYGTFPMPCDCGLLMFTILTGRLCADCDRRLRCR